MKFLLYKWKVFNQQDIVSAIERQGHQVDVLEEDEALRKSRDIKTLTEIVREYDIVFSVNYFQRVSNACMCADRKYIVWTVDSPMISMFHSSVFNECNYIFVFDKFNYYQFRNLGVKNVFYMPLAVDTKRLDELIANLSSRERELYGSDISFVGGMYYKNSYDDISGKLPDYLRGYFDAALLAQLDVYGENVFDKMLTVDILEHLSQCVEFENEPDSLSDLKLIFTNTFLGFKLAQIERVVYLNALAGKFRVDLYTDKTHEDLRGVNVRGTLDYQHDMPKAFNCSKINLNFTIRNIRTGLPLRIWDVLGAGGFLMTNFQAEIPAYFENGRDLVVFEDIEDLKRKCEYYLNHDEERMFIAKNGHDKVKEKHSYDVRIREMLDILCL